MRTVYIVCGAIIAAGCNTERSEQPAASSAAPNSEPPQRAADQAAPTTTSTSAPNVPIGGVASCQPSEEVTHLASRWIGLADADGNRDISRQEAQSFTNFLLGGFFFRADADGNGVVTPEEGRVARAELINQHPGLSTLLSQARTATGQSPFKALASILDVEYGKPLSAEDARQAARAALDDLFRVADADSNGTITTAEARDASWRGARALGQQAFKTVDTNDDGNLALEEFQAAVSQTAKIAFDAADANDNRQLTEQEAAVAMSSVVRRLGIPPARQN